MFIVGCIAQMEKYRTICIVHSSVQARNCARNAVLSSLRTAVAFRIRVCLPSGNVEKLYNTFRKHENRRVYLARLMLLAAIGSQKEKVMHGCPKSILHGCLGRMLLDNWIELCGKLAIGIAKEWPVGT